MSLQPASFFASPRRNLLRIFMLLGASDKPIRGAILAKELGISLQAVEWCMKGARNNDLYIGARGASGGYSLTVKPKDITILDIIGFTILPEEEPYGLNVLMRRMVDLYDEITLQDLLDWNE